MKEKQMEEEWIGTSELAELWNTSATTIKRHTYNGHLPHIKFGSTTRYDWKLLSEMVKRNYPINELQH